MTRFQFAIKSIAISALITWTASCFGQEKGFLISAFSSAPGHQPPAPWRVVGVPSGKMAITAFDLAVVDGRTVLRVEANASYGNLVHAVPPSVPGADVRLHWRWRLDQPLLKADLRRKEGDDSPLKVCALFDMPLDQLGLLDRNMLRLARSLTGEKLPSATLCYVWDATLPVGTLLSNAYSARVRIIVVDSGAQRLGQWVAHHHDLGADFRRAFGQDKSASLPPLEAIVVGADADNTAGHSLGYVDDVTLAP